ncbi:hypothetical protein KC686_01820 [Candidatus Woesebacteria bacterium]|nr:hypothetical protein [Candidatus Woesebacteria bacterium]
MIEGPDASVVDNLLFTCQTTYARVEVCGDVPSEVVDILNDFLTMKSLEEGTMIGASELLSRLPARGAEQLNQWYSLTEGANPDVLVLVQSVATVRLYLDQAGGTTAFTARVVVKYRVSGSGNEDLDVLLTGALRDAMDRGTIQAPVGVSSPEIWGIRLKQQLQGVIRDYPGVEVDVILPPSRSLIAYNYMIYYQNR